MAKLYICTLGLFGLLSCSNYDAKLETALAAAGENRPQLEHVLAHYQNDTAKLAAAKFLIANTTDHYWQDTSGLFRAEPILRRAGEMYEERLLGLCTDTQIADTLNPLWDKLRSALPSPAYYSDLRTVTAEFLIDHIERSFAAWKANPHTRSCDFELFCTQILPYRLACEEKTMESGAAMFPQTVPEIALRDAVDSVLTKYHNVRYNTNILSSFPFLTARHLRAARYGSCFDQVWLNTLILSGAGFAVGADMVPLWGNRNSSHTWNVVILDKGTILPIDAFLAQDRWELTKMYDNISTDNMGWWGPFRLPKVFRYSYQAQANEIVDRGEVAQEDIPPFFRSRHYVDVSDQYFRPTTVAVDPTEAAPADAHYIFLCCAQTQTWVPVAYTPIRGPKAHFERMGRDIAYLPAYYKAGQIIPAGAPIYVDSSGNTRTLEANKGLVQSMVLRRVYFMGQRFRDGNKALGGMEVYGAAKSDFSDSVLLGRLPQSVEARPYLFDAVSDAKVRYIRFYQPSTSPISELSVLDDKNKIIKPKHIEMPLADSNQKKQLYTLCDSVYNGGMLVRHRATIDSHPFPVKVQYDLGVLQRVSRFLFCGYKDNNGIEPRKSYELFYWNTSNHWGSCGVRTALDYSIRYDNVPSSALYYLKASDGTAGRIFTYSSGKQLFL